MFEENARARLPEMCRSEDKVQRGRRTKEKEERYGGRKRNREGKREGDKDSEAEEDREFRKRRRQRVRKTEKRKNLGF